MQIEDSYQYDKATLLLGVRSDYELFILFVLEGILEQICEDANAFAALRRSKDTPKPHARLWKKTTVNNLRAYIAACLWTRSCYKREINDYLKQARNTLFHKT